VECIRELSHRHLAEIRSVVRSKLTWRGLMRYRQVLLTTRMRATLLSSVFGSSVAANPNPFEAAFGSQASTAVINMTLTGANV
jgi:hypothetical protein